MGKMPADDRLMSVRLPAGDLWLLRQLAERLEECPEILAAIDLAQPVSEYAVGGVDEIRITAPNGAILSGSAACVAMQLNQSQDPVDTDDGYARGFGRSQIELTLEFVGEPVYTEASRGEPAEA